MVKEMSFDYVVDQKNRVVICMGIVPVRTPDGDWIEAVLDKAVARCSKGDEFDIEFGKRLAQRKLLLKVNKKERNGIAKVIKEQKDCLEALLREQEKLEKELIRHTVQYTKIIASKYPVEDRV